MDALDRRLLERLQRDADITNQALADEIGLSASACLKRVKRLREDGTIDRVVALLQSDAVEPGLHIVVEVTMERDHASLYRRFEERVREAPEVKQCYVVTGECDFVLIVRVRDLDAYDRFCGDVLHADDNVRKFRTLVSRRRTKFDTTVAVTPGG